MKRLSKLERLRIADEHVRYIQDAWKCRHGEWNAQKIQDEVERGFREDRRQR